MQGESMVDSMQCRMANLFREIDNHARKPQQNDTDDPFLPAILVSSGPVG